MKRGLVLLVLFCSGCGSYGGYGSYESTYKAPQIKTYNEIFPVLEWEVEKNRMDIEAMKREQYR